MVNVLQDPKQFRLIIPDEIEDGWDLETKSTLRERVSLELAELKAATQVIVRNHYLHRGRTMAQLPYWVLLDSRRVGVILYSYPRMSATFMGYRPMNLLELARLWVDPAVQGRTTLGSDGREHAFALGSCAVGKSLRRIRQDWHGKYPHLPDVLAVVSWADSEHHEGVIYRAANFREAGISGGSLHGNTYRRNGGHDQLNPDYRHLKKTFLYEFRRVMPPMEAIRAERDWANLRPPSKGKKSSELPQVESRLPL